MSPMYGAGAKFSVNFGPYHGVFLEGLFNKSSQDFIYNTAASTDDFDYTIEWQNIDLYVLYRGIRNRTYFEIGPMYSMIQKVEQADQTNDFVESTDFYESAYLGAGFGFRRLPDRFRDLLYGAGFPMNYGFADIVNR